MAPTLRSAPALGTRRPYSSPCMPPAGLAPPTRFAAVLFDLDGVLTPTADIHHAARGRTMFDEFLVPRGLAPFTDDDYLRYVDGKPRFDGVRSFLASRDITLPDGDPADPPSQDSVAGLGNRKNDLFLEILRRDGIAPYPGLAALPRPPRTARHEGRRRVVVAQRPRGARRRPAWRRASTSSPTAWSPPPSTSPASRRPTCSSNAAERLGVGAGRRRRRRGRRVGRRRRPRRATSASSSASTAAPAPTPCASTAPTSSSTTSPSCWTAAVKREAPRAPRPRPLPARSVAPRRARARPRRPRPHRDAVRRSATATSACAPTPRRAARRTATARSSTASTRRGTSTTPRTRSASPSSARRSSTCPTPS